MNNFNDVTGEDTIDHNPDRYQTFDHPSIITIIGGSGSRIKKHITEAITSSTRY